MDIQIHLLQVVNCKVYQSVKLNVAIRSDFTAQLQEIRRMSLAAIICDNADQIGSIQPLVFRQPSPT